MKKIVKFLTLFMLSLSLFLVGLQEVKTIENIAAESAIIVDAKTGDILYSKNADIKLPPASMTKMMSEYLVLEAISEGTITWDTTTQISDYAYSISANTAFSGIGLRQGQDYTVRQLYEGMAIISDNATTIALAELVSGSETAFVKLMNERGASLGLTDFKFVNSTGLNNSSLGENRPEGTGAAEDNLMSAKDTAKLAFHLLNDYPEVLEFSSKIRSELDEQPLENLNWMLPWNNDNFSPFYYEGVDGLKTGFTSEAGYCFTGTVKRGEQRLITVVMRTDSPRSRFEETKKLMEYAFTNFSETTLFEAGDTVPEIETVPVAKGKEDVVGVELSADINKMIKTDDEGTYALTYHLSEDILNEAGEIEAPVEAGTKIGTASLKYVGEESDGNIAESSSAHTVDLLTAAPVEKANWFILTLSAIGSFFADLYTMIVDTVKGWFN